MSNIEIVESNEYEVQEIIKHKVGIVRNVLTKEECDEIIGRTNNKGFTKYDEENRLDQRDKFEWFEEENSTLSLKIFNAIKSLLKPELSNNRKPVGIRDKLRLYKYEVGEIFAPHVDGGYTYRYGPKKGQSAVYTYVVYLNGKESGLEGGSTNFFDVKDWPEGISTEIEPEVGKVVVFQQKDFKHEGGVITRGTKYIIQGMVMYSKPTKIEEDGRVVDLPLPFPNIFELVPVSSKSSLTKWRSTTDTAEELNLSDHQRYLLMFKAGHPLEVIQNSMKVRGLSADLIEQWSQKLLNDLPNFMNSNHVDVECNDENVKKGEVEVKNEGYKNTVCYKMLKAGIGRQQVIQRMVVISNLDPAAAELLVQQMYELLEKDEKEQSENIIVV